MKANPEIGPANRGGGGGGGAPGRVPPPKPAPKTNDWFSEAMARAQKK
jgi:hypothetical protein